MNRNTLVIIEFAYRLSKCMNHKTLGINDKITWKNKFNFKENTLSGKKKEEIQTNH